MPRQKSPQTLSGDAQEVETLRGLFHFCLKTGKVVRKKNGRDACRPWADGYLYVYVPTQGRTVGAHRLAWFLAMGRWPKGVIDHKNGVRTDNRFFNLRDVSVAENSRAARRRKDTKETIARTEDAWRRLMSLDVPNP